MDRNIKREELLQSFMLYSFDKLGKSFEDGRDSLLGARGFYTLYVLGAYGQKNMTDLGEACNMKKQQTTKVVDKLNDLGLAHRIYSKQDRRVIEIAITEQGKQFLMTQVYSGADRLFEQLAQMDEETQESFFSAIEVLNPILKQFA